MSNWEGPMTIVLYLSDEEAMNLDQILDAADVYLNRTSISVHVVYKRQIYNPINYLRNVALNHTHAPYILYLDADFVPNPNLYKSIKVLIKKHMADRNSKTVLVVPAFQMFTDLGDETPKIKAEVVKQLAKNTITGFGMEHAWILGHAPTKFEYWVTADKPYEAIYADGFEPYVVVKKDCKARYSEIFLERMRNKISYAERLYAEGYDFYVIPDDFIIHVPHPYTKERKEYYTIGDYYYCSNKFMTDFRKELYAQFPGRKAITSNYPRGWLKNLRGYKAV